MKPRRRTRAERRNRERADSERLIRQMGRTITISFPRSAAHVRRERREWALAMLMAAGVPT